MTGEEWWRRLLAIVNLFQFCDGFTFRTTSEFATTGADGASSNSFPISDDWLRVMNQASVSVRSVLEKIALTGGAFPRVEYYDENLPEEVFAELAWPEKQVVILVGDQCSFASRWRELGWIVFTDDQLAASGCDSLLNILN